MANEFARQAFHFCSVGLLLLAAVLLDQPWFLLLCSAVLFLGSLLVYMRPSFVQRAIDVFDRDDASFPGKGAFMAVLGAFLTALVFPGQLVEALAVLAVADAFATVAGMRLGRVSTPWSPRKTWVGVGAFFVSACATLFFFGPGWWLAALCATVVEAADYHAYPFLDDNVLIPLTVGAALLLW